MTLFVNVAANLFFILLFLLSLKTHGRRINMKVLSYSEFIISKNAQVFLPLLRSYSSLCVVCEKNDTLISFTNTLLTNNISTTLTIQELSKPIKSNCESTIVLEVNITEKCIHMNFRYSREKFVFISSNVLDTSELLQCLRTFQLVILDVVSVNLQEGTVYQFSPRFNQFEEITSEFSFDETNYNLTKKQRTPEHLPNLGNITVNIAALLFPPLEIFEEHHGNNLLFTVENVNDNVQ